MTAELPDDLVVTDAGVQVRYIRPERDRRPAVMNGVDVPVHVVAGTRERQTLVSEEVVTSGENPVSACGCVGRRVRPTDVDRAHQHVR